MKHGNARILDLILPVSNWNPSTSTTEDFTYVDISSVDTNQKRITEPKTIACSAAPSRARQIIQTADILVSTVRPNLNCVAYVPNELEGSIASTGFCVLRPDEQALYSRYLFHWVQSKAFVGDMVSKATGASYPAVSDSIIKSSEIPLPPLEEQRRIASILDQINRLLQHAKDACALNEQLHESIFHHSFGSFDRATAKYPILKLEDICSQITDGEHQTPFRSESGVKLLSARNIRNGRLDFEDVDYVSIEEFARIGRRCAPVRGDVLISCSGSIGRVAVVDTDEPLAMVRSAAMARPIASKVMPLFLEALLRTRHLQQCMQRSANASSQANLFQGKIRALPVFLPSTAEQKVFTARILKVRSSFRSLSNRIIELQALLKSSESKMFSGEIQS